MSIWPMLACASAAAVPMTLLVCALFRRGYIDAPASYILSIPAATILMTKWLPPSYPSTEAESFDVFLHFIASFPLVLPALVPTYILAKRIFK